MKFVQPIREKEKIEEMKTVLKRKSSRNWMMFVLGINFGYRISDLVQLKVKHVRGKTHISIQEAKTEKTSRIKIRESIVDEINRYIEIMNDEEYLFPSRKGGEPIKRVQAYRILNEAAREIGLEEIGCHSLRKTFSYHIYMNTKDVALVQNFLNHSSPSVTLRYIGINQDLMDAAIDELDI